MQKKKSSSSSRNCKRKKVNIDIGSVLFPFCLDTESVRDPDPTFYVVPDPDPTLKLNN